MVPVFQYDARHQLNFDKLHLPSHISVTNARPPVMEEQKFEPPPYTDVISAVPARDPVTHTAFLPNRHGKPFATLNVVSHAPSAEHSPIVHEGEPVIGALYLKLEEETALKSIDVSVSICLANIIAIES